MEDKFQNKYRIASARLVGFDYSQNGAYFVTICTKNRECFFGDIVETHGNASLRREMRLSEMGTIVRDEWQKTLEIRANVDLDEWVVMPNHFHGIINIDNNIRQCDEYQNKFGPQSQNLSAIIRGFKGAVTKRIHMSGFDDFAWQERFYDHVIRNDEELDRIREYIANNPYNWNIDKLFQP